MLNLPGCLKRSVQAIMCTDASLLDNIDLKETWILSCVIPTFPFQFSKQLHIPLLMYHEHFPAVHCHLRAVWLQYCCLNLLNFWCKRILTSSPKQWVGALSLLVSIALCGWIQELEWVETGGRQYLTAGWSHAALSSWLCPGRWTHTQHELSSSSARTVSINSHQEPCWGPNWANKKFCGGVWAGSLLPQVPMGT